MKAGSHGKAGAVINRIKRLTFGAATAPAPAGERTGTTWSKREAALEVQARYLHMHEAYAQKLHIDFRELLSARRYDPLPDMRAAGMYALRRKGLTLVETANAFGRVNHTTVMQAEKKIAEYLKLYGEKSDIHQYVTEAMNVYTI